MEPIVGTPAIVGFGNGFNGNDLSLGLTALLLQQNLGRDHADIMRDIHTTTTAVQEQVDAQGAANQLATEKTGAAAILAVAGVQLEMAKIAGISALTAATNTAAIQAAIAECCCESKALIIEKANGTDALIRQIEDARVRDLLADAKAEIAALRAAAA